MQTVWSFLFSFLALAITWDKFACIGSDKLLKTTSFSELKKNQNDIALTAPSD